MKLSLAIAVFCALSLVGSSALAQMGDDGPPPERQPTVTPMPKKPSAGPHGPRQARPNYDRIELKKTEKALREAQVESAFQKGRMVEMEKSHDRLASYITLLGLAFTTLVLFFLFLLYKRQDTPAKAAKAMRVEKPPPMPSSSPPPPMPQLADD